MTNEDAVSIWGLAALRMLPHEETCWICRREQIAEMARAYPEVWL